MHKITAEMIPNKGKFVGSDAYEPYKKVRELNGQPFVGKTIYLEIISLFFLFIKNLMLKGRTVELPANMGEMCISGLKPRVKVDSEGRPKLPPDWGETRKLWERDPVAKAEKRIIFHFNEHSGFVRYKIYWKRDFFAHMDNIKYYSFQGARHFTREIAQAIFDGAEYDQRQLKYVKNGD